jgi:hypothetical protein
MCDRYVCSDPTVGYHQPKGTSTPPTPPTFQPVQRRKPWKLSEAGKANWRADCVIACSHAGVPSRRQIRDCVGAPIPGSYPTFLPACGQYLCPELCQWHNCSLFSPTGAWPAQ